MVITACVFVRVCVAISYTLTTLDWTPCAGRCGSVGYQTRGLTCHDQNGNTVYLSYCGYLPPTMQQCTVPACSSTCSPGTYLTPYGGCAPCRAGYAGSGTTPECSGECVVSIESVTNRHRECM